MSLFRNPKKKQKDWGIAKAAKSLTSMPEDWMDTIPNTDRKVRQGEMQTFDYRILSSNGLQKENLHIAVTVTVLCDKSQTKIIHISLFHYIYLKTSKSNVGVYSFPITNVVA
jgi:hypothetical protein